jgi:hypothetical protein
MSDIIPTTPFLLEDLPVEILLEIFQYMEIIDLLSFKGHNQHLNNVIRNFKLNIVFNSSIQETKKQLEYLMMLSPNQVIRLEQHYGQILVDLNEFQELRYLTWNCCFLSISKFYEVSLMTWRYFFYRVDKIINLV